MLVAGQLGVRDDVPAQHSLCHILLHMGYQQQSPAQRGTVGGVTK
jgi:hypothetical protein